MAGEPTAALRFTGVQRAASVGAPPAIPATVYSFVHWAILWVDGFPPLTLSTKDFGVFLLNKKKKKLLEIFDFFSF